MMTETESVRLPMKILVERIPKELIDKMTLVFDNSCKLHNYIQARCPDFFAGISNIKYLQIQLQNLKYLPIQLYNFVCIKNPSYFKYLTILFIHLQDL